MWPLCGVNILCVNLIVLSIRVEVFQPISCICENDFFSVNLKFFLLATESLKEDFNQQHVYDKSDTHVYDKTLATLIEVVRLMVPIIGQT